MQFVLEAGEELHYGWNDVEAGDPTPEDFVDPDPPPLPPDPLADDPDADFLRRIYLSPEDDAPREDYAVVLAAREDPRGEFIALQLARARGEEVAEKRESQLLAKHAAQWGSPILDEVDRQAFCHTWNDARSAPAKRYEGVRFERGFLSHVSMFRNTIRTAGYFDHPAWSTVRNIAWTPVVSEAMGSLQDVGGPSSILKQIAKCSRPLSTVRIGPRPGPWPGGPEPYPDVRPGALQIRRFIVYQPQGLLWVERILSMSPRVEFIEFRGLDLDQVADWDWSPIDRASALRSIELSSLTSMHRIDASVALARGEAGWVADIVARGDPSDLWQLMLAVERCFGRRPVTELSFVLVGLHEDDPSPVVDGGGRSIPRYYDSLTAGIAGKLAAVADRVTVEIQPPDGLR